LLLNKIERDVVTIVTQVVVDRDDPSIKDPNKFVGQFYTEVEAKNLARKEGWVVKEDRGRGWRRVVPSPIPRTIINGGIIRELVHSGKIVIAAGGGGIPVYREDDGRWEGVDAVIDKDRASAVLGIDIGAQILLIMTEADGVYLDYNTPDQQKLTNVSLEEIKGHMARNQFPKGSMGPKIEAAVQFLEGGGKKVIISSVDDGFEALEGRAGTCIM